jgi:(1->4)-alpha-D-glucan 1-alpha-D-glucosylmutase
MPPEPIATYRIQLRPDFGFDRAAELVPYLAEFGISHLYLSPYLQAAAGSEHGYDVVDPTRLNEELGGAPAHERLCRALQEAGLGQVVDLVPNHMAIAGRQNPWWWDVLENGPSSRYATFFDVDWDASEERWPNKVLLPVLGDHYGRILERGELRLSCDGGLFVLHYHEHLFPLDPSSLAGFLGRVAESCGSEELAFLARSHARLPRPTVTARQAVELRHRDKGTLAALLARLWREEPATWRAVTEEVERLNGDPDGLDALLEQQNYRLAFWRTASRDLDYRRFFDIQQLAGLRVEEMEVFRATHDLVIGLVEKGLVQGMRIDHPDGLRDPGDYFRRLRRACPEAWIVAEKILEPGEELPPDWPIAGTTGYDFLNRVGGLFVDPRGEEPMSRIYRDFLGEEGGPDATARGCKRQVLSDLLGSELNRLTSLFVAVCERHRRHRDYTSYDLNEALCETAACFPVYRTYFSPAAEEVREEQKAALDLAVEWAREARHDLDPELFAFLREILLLRIPGELEQELAMRFQQLTGPAMAKGVEDTLFYRANRLIPLNEVGGDPGTFGVDPEAFHRACTRALARHPRGMLASTTHDTKRSEDVRARLALLSEMPGRWEEAVRRWAAMNERHRRSNAPDRNTEYLLYQTLAGAWPIDGERAWTYLEKAVREAKVHTSWTERDGDYEEDLRLFVAAVMGDREFLADLEGFVAGLLQPGRINSLAQTLLKLTAPGVPDLYQGTELWTLSLVDPDNRRPVDFARRRELLAAAAAGPPAAWLEGMETGLPKLALIRRALDLRRRRPELFGPEGAYRPLPTRGAKARHLVAFTRGERAVALAPRLVLGLAGEWGETVVDLPRGRWRDLFTGAGVAGGEVPVGELLATFPVGLLERKEEG